MILKLPRYFIAATGLLAVISTATISYAQETDLGDVSATIQNAFSVADITVANVGTIAIVVVPLTLDTATLTITPTGGISITNMADAYILDVDNSAVTNGVIDISGAAPNTQINIAFATLSNLVCATCLPGNPDINLGSYTTDTGLTPFTDGSGNLTVNYGLTISTNPGVPYEDGVYTGQYQVTVNY